VDDVRKKGHDLFCLEVCDWACLSPHGEFVHGNQQVGVALGAFHKGPTMSNPHTANDHVTGMVCRA
jgi:hypothetical protein